MDIRQAIREALGGGADINAGNPLPVDTAPGNKSVTEILDEALIALAVTSLLADCTAIDLTGGPPTLALTVQAVYNAAAVLGVRIHVRTSPTNDATGTHTPAAPSATIMTDANAHFQAGALVGLTIENDSDSSSGVITANTATTVTVAALAGGSDNTWELNDAYSITGADYDSIDWDIWNPSFTAGATIRQTQHYDVSPGYVKVLVENLDAAEAVTDVTVRATVGA